MEISRRDLLKTTATSGLIAAGLAASEGLFKPLLSQAETDDEGTSYRPTESDADGGGKWQV